MEYSHTRICRDTFFEGTINARSVTVEGKVRGEVNAADKILIREGGIVHGPIKTQKIFLEEGASHNGRIILTDNSLDEAKDAAAAKENEQPEEENGHHQKNRQEKDCGSLPGDL